MADIDDPKSVISVMNVKQVRRMIKSGIISGGMIPKVDCCIAGVEAGVQSVHILDGRIEHCLILEIFTKKGVGTLIEA